MRERWLSKRAITIHLITLFFVPLCGLAAWWQVTRAFGGNGLSYLYSVEWPIFAIIGVYFWWMLIHTDYDAVGLRGMRARMESARVPDPASALAPDATSDGTAVATAVATSVEDVVVTAPVPALEVDDPELAAYNARLAQLADQGAKTWRTREQIVARRAR
jgi:hypothetical protein